jgi:hypothetical protein
VYIFSVQAYAACLRGRLSSNVRHQRRHFGRHNSGHSPLADKPTPPHMRKLAHTVAIALVVASAAGCASLPDSVSKNYVGPTAKVLDWGGNIERSKAELYVLRAIDGQKIQTAIEASQSASAGRGFSLTVMAVERDVPTRPMKATLVATHVTAAPIHELASRAAGTFYEVTGVVDFDPKPGKTYVVMAKLAAKGSQVWIEEQGTKLRVTEIVSAP